MNSVVSAMLIMYVRCVSGLGHMGVKSPGTQVPDSAWRSSTAAAALDFLDAISGPEPEPANHEGPRS